MADKEPQPSARDHYRAGLSQVREAVISEHFMHRLNNDGQLDRLDAQAFSQRALTLSARSLRETLLPLLTDASRRFAGQRVRAAKQRAVKNFDQYLVATPEDLSPADVMTEVLYDRQFLRSSNENVSRATVARKIAGLFARREPIQMVIPALPYKCTSPLKCRGASPDLAEVGFLLSLYEMAQAVDTIYREAIGGSDHSLASFIVISDGRRFSEFLLEPDERIARYQARLKEWISFLSIADYVAIEDYADALSRRLPSRCRADKSRIRKDVYQQYCRRMASLLDPSDMSSSLANAIRHEPDPEIFYAEGRFVPLLKSLVYTINYEALEQAAGGNGESFERVYSTLTGHIFLPFTSTDDVSRAPHYEDLRRQMLQQVWDATMRYLAEIRSDRDMEDDPIATCFPNSIRWTIHAKHGQLAIQSNPSLGVQVQPWHGAGVFKSSKNGSVKLCALPCALIEKLGGVPVLLGADDGAADIAGGSIAPLADQPLFYILAEAGVSTLEELLAALTAGYTRRRK